MTHPDYPPLLPLFVAQAWACSGVITPFVPTLIALSFGSATGLLLISSVSFLRSPHAGLLAGGLLLTSPIFLAAAMIQYADIPLSFYMLLAVVLFYCADQRADRGVYVLAGLAAACAALTKNEGSFFLVVLASARMVRFCLRRQIRQELRALAPLALGLAPLILALLYYKSFASPNELINQHGGYSAKLLSGSRYLAIAKAAYEGILHPKFLAQSAGFKVGLNWQVPAFVIFSLLVGFERKRALHPSVVFMSVTALFICLGYFLVYVLTPYELEWHLRTSIDRLLAQPAPIFICAAVLSLGSFEPGNDTSPSAP